VPRIVLLHTSDLHNRLSPAAAQRLTDLKRARRGALLLDAGDAVGAGNLTARPMGEPILRQMSDIGYEAMAMGNRESHLFEWPLTIKLRDAKFPVLASNLHAAKRALPPQVRPHATFETNGGRIAVFGLVPRMTKPGSLWARIAHYLFEDPVVTASRIAPQLRNENDFVVCLSHCSEAVNAQIAALPEVDVILGGHTHRAQVREESGSALTVYAGHYGSHVGLTELSGRDDAHATLISLEKN